TNRNGPLTGDCTVGSERQPLLGDGNARDHEDSYGVSRRPVAASPADGPCEEDSGAVVYFPSKMTTWAVLIEALKTMGIAAHAALYLPLALAVSEGGLGGAHHSRGQPAVLLAAWIAALAGNVCISWVYRPQRASRDRHNTANVILTLLATLLALHHLSRAYLLSHLCPPSAVPAGCQEAVRGPRGEPAATLALLALCLVAPRTQHSQDYANSRGLPPVTLSSPYLSLVTFTWPVRFIYKAFRKSDITCKDMPRLPVTLTARHIYGRARRLKLSTESVRAMCLSLYSGVLPLMVARAAFTLVLPALSVMSVYIFQRILKEFEEVSYGRGEKGRLMMLIQALFALKFARSMADNCEDILETWIEMQLKVWQSMTIVEATLARKERAVRLAGSQDFDSGTGRAYGILTSDLRAAAEIFQCLLGLVSVPVSLALRLGLLYSIIGPPSLIVPALSGFNWFWVKVGNEAIQEGVKKASKLRDKRLEQIQELLECIQTIKLY
ncbi:hypothetical protein EV182_005248, partial [Spiromyces aspiralis]